MTERHHYSYPDGSWATGASYQDEDRTSSILQVVKEMADVLDGTSEEAQMFRMSDPTPETYTEKELSDWGVEIVGSKTVLRLPIVSWVAEQDPNSPSEPGEMPNPQRLDLGIYFAKKFPDRSPSEIFDIAFALGAEAAANGLIGSTGLMYEEPLLGTDT
ncbi:MAG: hypothetical protein WDN66_00205 [Candidatus Saccharibacteria bacterium]